MARRGGWWRSIPPELGVPIVILDLVRLVSGLAAGSRASLYVSVAVTIAPILVLCGLRELRRRLAGTPARLVGVAAGVQALVAAQLVIVPLVLPLLPLDIGREIWAINRYASLAEAVCLALVVGTAARAWRSVLGLLLVVAVVLDDGARLSPRWLWDVLGDRDAITVYFVLLLAPVMHQVALLAIYGRLGATVQASPEPARAVRAARRAAISQWLRVGAVAIVMGSAGALKALGGSLSEAVFGLATLAIVGTTMGTISGLLGLARSHVVGLSPLALCTAAFGALWLAIAGEVLTVVLYLGELDRGPSAWFVDATLATLACFLCVAAGAAAIRGYAARLGDRPLARVLSRRLALIVALDLAVVGCLAVARPETGAGIVGVMVSLLVFHTAANAALADMCARLAHRLKLAVAVDAF